MIPKIYGFHAHWNTFNIKRVGQDLYVIKKDDAFYLIHDRCHHRGYHMFRNLRESDNVDLDHHRCPVHGQKGFVDNLVIRQLVLDPSGLVCEQQFANDEFSWVKQIQSENKLQYHSSVEFENRGDWRFQVEINVDMMHVDHIHPWLQSTMDPDNMHYTRGENWVAQYWKNTAWWGFIYPYYQYEYQPGAVYFSELIPNGIESFSVRGHFYFDPDVDIKECLLFKDLTVKTYEEDLAMVADMGEFYGPYQSSHPQEIDMVHWHDWYWRHKDQIVI